MAERLLEHLPAIYRAQPDPTLGRLLSAFEELMIGAGDTARPGIEELLDGLEMPDGRHSAGAERYFDPGPYPPPSPGAVSPSVATRAAIDQAPSEFLPWLTQWVALAEWAGLSELGQRDFIARAVQLYRLRGTRDGLREVIRVHTRLAPDIDELGTPMQIGVTSTVGVGTLLDGGAPFFFRVNINLSTTDPDEIREHVRVVRTIVDIEKPAHTHYTYRVRTPALQIGVHSTIGADTLLGAPPT